MGIKTKPINHVRENSQSRSKQLQNKIVDGAITEQQ